MCFFYTAVCVGASQTVQMAVNLSCKRSRMEIRMKYLKQITIILAVSLLGELMKYFIPLPIPASIYGMIIMFITLITGIVKLENVSETAKFLIAIMPLMFVPAGVGLMVSWGVLKPMLIPVVIITVVGYLAVAITTGRVAQRIIKLGKKEKSNERFF